MLLRTENLTKNYGSFRALDALDLTLRPGEVLSSIRVVQAFTREDYEQARFERENQQRVSAGIRARTLQAQLKPMVELLVTAGTVLVLAFSCLCVAVELFLNSTGYFHWEYWWWNTPNVVLIVLLGYVPFFAVAAWVFDMGADRRRQLRAVGAILAVDVALGVALAAAGWL